MKKSLLLLFTVICSISVFSQELNIPAQFLKEKNPDMYEAVKTFAINKWKDDQEMILHEINGQAESYVALFKYGRERPEGFKEVYANALKKWSNGDISPGKLANPTIDWKMVLYEVEKQLKARNAY